MRSTTDHHHNSFTNAASSPRGKQSSPSPPHKEYIPQQQQQLHQQQSHLLQQPIHDSQQRKSSSPAIFSPTAVPPTTAQKQPLDPGRPGGNIDRAEYFPQSQNQYVLQQQQQLQQQQSRQPGSGTFQNGRTTTQQQQSPSPKPSTPVNTVKSHPYNNPSAAQSNYRQSSASPTKVNLANRQQQPATISAYNLSDTTTNTTRLKQQPSEQQHSPPPKTINSFINPPNGLLSLASSSSSPSSRKLLLTTSTTSLTQLPRTSRFGSPVKPYTQKQQTYSSTTIIQQSPKDEQQFQQQRSTKAASPSSTQKSPISARLQQIQALEQKLTPSHTESLPSNSSNNNNNKPTPQISTKKFQENLKQIRESYDISLNIKRPPAPILFSQSGSPRSPSTPKNKNTFYSETVQSKQALTDESHSDNIPAASSSSNDTQKFASISAVLKTRAGAYNRFYRKVNQDTGLFMPRFLGSRFTSLYGVYDGHGENGALASKFIKNSILQHLSHEINLLGGLENSDAIDFSECLRRAYAFASRDILNQFEFDVSFSGCTAVTVLLHKCKIYCANTGDSRAVLFKSLSLNDDDILALSNDHKPELPVEAGRIEAMGGRVDQIRNVFGEPVGIFRVWKRDLDLPGLAMSRSMGDAVARECGVIAEPEIQVAELLKDSQRPQFLVIASDGVWDQLTNHEVGKVILPYIQGNRISEAADKLISVSNALWQRKGDSVDDITSVVIFVNGFKDIVATS